MKQSSGGTGEVDEDGRSVACVLDPVKRHENKRVRRKGGLKVREGAREALPVGVETDCTEHEKKAQQLSLSRCLEVAAGNSMSCTRCKR